MIRHCGLEEEHDAHEWEIDEKIFECVGTTAAGAEIARRARYASLPRWEPPAPIEWGSTMCTRKRCVAVAAVALDGIPYCVEHVDEEIERACMTPELAAMMPPLDE